MSDRPQNDEPDEVPTYRSGPPSDPATAPTISQPGPDSRPVEDATGAEGSGRLPRSGRLPGSSRLGSSRGTGRVGLHDGDTFAGRFEIIHEIARGGMGVVYKARHIHLGNVVALKVMLAGSYATDEDCRRFILEAEAAARLKHPHIVPVHDIGEEGGQLYFTMDFVEGAPLSKRKEALGRPRLLEVMIQVVDAISYAHQRGIIHRDLKPANIMMTAGEDSPLIMDFGLAKQVALVDGEGKPSMQTREGAIMGTPHYMPPEQAEGASAEIDVRSDVYALGVILYELWTGRLPFEGRSISELLLKIFERDPEPPRSVDRTIDRDMEAIILKAIEKQKVARYESAAELKRDLESLRDGRPVQARRAGVVYKASKWLRRHRGSVAAFAALTVVIGGAAGVVVEGRREAAQKDARERAGRLDEGQRTRARNEEALPELAASLQALERGGGDEAARALRERVAPMTSSVAALVALLERDQSPEASAEALALQALATKLALIDRGAERALAVSRERDLAEQSVARVGALEEQAVANLQAQAGAGADVAAATLEEALARFRDLPAQPPRAPSPGDAAFGRVGPALDAASGHVFTLLNLAPDGSPARARATQLVADLARLRQELYDRALEVERTRLGARLLAAAARVLDLLDDTRASGAKGDARARLLPAAALAQALVQRAHELAPLLGAKDGDDLRPRAGRAYGDVLLDLKAYEVFDAELERLAAGDHRRALQARREREVRATAELEVEIAQLAQAPEGRGAAELESRLARLAELAQDPNLPVELKVKVSDATARVASTRERLLLQDVYGAIDAASQRARAPDALAAAEEVDRELARAEALLDARRELFEARALDAARARCRSARADLLLAAARAARVDEPGRALDLATRALDHLRAVPGREADAGAAARLVAELGRLQGTPEGMVALPGGVLEREGDRAAEVAPYYLSKLEVTNADYAAYLVDHADAPAPPAWSGRAPPEGQAELPVTGLGFEAARRFAAARGCRLPTDTEWELAARVHGERRTEFPWGDAFEDGRLAARLERCGANEKDVTPAGIFDLGGNVSEWVTLEDGSPAIRGASFLYPQRRIARGTHRLTPHSDDYSGPQVGLRLAKGVKGP